MITIYYTQCDRGFDQDDFSMEMAWTPFIPRCREYENTLSGLQEDGSYRPLQDATFRTLDDCFILIALYLKRRRKIDNLLLVSVCGCTGYPKQISIPIDDDGNLTEICHHSFFQRLNYLR